ncbi:dipeptidase [bacterium]|nr:dipeptidase [bacterium]
MQKVEFPVFDGHNDSLFNWYFEGTGSMSPFLSEQASKHVDLARARRGGMVGGICAICTPPTPQGFGDTEKRIIRREGGYEVPLPPPLDSAFAMEFGLRAVKDILALEVESGGRFRVVRNRQDLDSIGSDDTFRAVVHLEGAEPVAGNLSNLRALYDLGLRSVGPVWSRPNVFGHGVPFVFPSTPDTGPGLTSAGERLVRECEEMGIMIDLSHLTERGFWDVARLSQRPLVISHSAVHTLCPSARNLTDKQIDAVAKSGGLIGVTFHVADLRSDGALNPQTPIDRIVDHLVYIADRVGAEHVALGSDFDGATIPAEMNDVRGLPILFTRLRSRGVSGADCRRIAVDNWVRVMKAVFCESGT